MGSLEDVRRLAAGDHGLATISVARADGSVHSSVINAGVMAHPVSGEDVVAAVLRGPSWKLRRIRQTLRCTVVFRAGWQWVSVDGPVDIVGPTDNYPGLEAEMVPTLLRDVFMAAGGSHDDWDEYDRVMAEDGRTAIFITPERIQSPG
jgi:PPOX class probable F420-dependent enzyme